MFPVLVSVKPVVHLCTLCCSLLLSFGTLGGEQAITWIQVQLMQVMPVLGAVIPKWHLNPCDWYTSSH